MKKNISLVAIGHEDNGKSTALGRLLFDVGAASPEEVEKHEKESADKGKSGCSYAWIMDKLTTERERDASVDFSKFSFETKSHKITVTDVPGHRNFMKNMITGTSQADCGLLVVSAAMDEFETSIGSDGLVKEHAMLAYTFGIKQLIVAVNKMDLIKYSQERFEEVKDKISACIKKAGYNPSAVAFVPISGMSGDNITKTSTNMDWFAGWKIEKKDKSSVSGVTLIEALEALDEPDRASAEKPLRIPVQDVFKIREVGTVPVGRVESGRIKTGMQVEICPGGIKSEVGNLENNHRPVDQGLPGDDVGFTTSNVMLKDLRRGMVISDPSDNPAKECRSFIAQMAILYHPNSIKVGYAPVFDCHTAHVSCRFVELIEKIDRKTGKTVEKSPKELTTNDVALVRLEPVHPLSLCVEPFSEFPTLGRFAIRDMRHTIAVGVIKSVEKV